MTFFIAANPTGTGNRGGIAGADRIYQNAAQASGGLNFNHTWHAYLSPTLPIGALERRFSGGAGPKMRVGSTAPDRKSPVV
jgi:hypothetical protein